MRHDYSTEQFQAFREEGRNGCYEREYVTPLGSIRLRVRRTRKRSFLPRGLQTLERRAPEVAELIRQAFLRGISTPCGGARGGARDRGAGQRADRVAADPGAGPSGGKIPSRGAGR